MPAPPLVVPRLTAEVVGDVRAVARAMPYRLERGVDAERVFWIDVAGRERVGIAYAPERAGAHWMIAIGRADGGKVTRARIREIVTLVAGPTARIEVAPRFDYAPAMTMVRVPATESAP